MNGGEDDEEHEVGLGDSEVCVRGCAFVGVFHYDVSIIEIINGRTALIFDI